MALPGGVAGAMFVMMASVLVLQVEAKRMPVETSARRSEGCLKAAPDARATPPLPPTTKSNGTESDQSTASGGLAMRFGGFDGDETNATGTEPPSEPPSDFQNLPMDDQLNITSVERVLDISNTLTRRNGQALMDLFVTILNLVFPGLGTVFKEAKKIICTVLGKLPILCNS